MRRNRYFVTRLLDTNDVQASGRGRFPTFLHGEDTPTVATNDSISILLCCSDVHRQNRLAQMLSPWATVWFSRDDLPEHELPMILIVDEAQLASTSAGELRPGQFDEHVGVISVGGGQGDIVLEDDAPLRELQLACRLLTQIVRLRCENREATHARREFHQLALTDPLTGLPNRRAWDDEIQRRMGRGSKTEASAIENDCVALLDLDHFKRINDDFGHCVGDQVLQATAQALSRSLRAGDFVVRLGGDEFGMLLDHVKPDQAARICERVRTRVGDELQGTAPRAVTASVGFYVIKHDSQGPSTEWMETASRALMQAKQTGRDRSVGM